MCSKSKRHVNVKLIKSTRKAFYASVTVHYKYFINMSSFHTYREESFVLVEDATTKDNVTYYKIVVKVGPVQWDVYHRYSDFVELHDRLVADFAVAKELLPPKKVIGNKTTKFVVKRREGLNDYLKNVVNYLKLTIPSELAHFLDFHIYDILYLLQDLAKKLYLEGDNLLQNEKSYKFTPLEVCKLISYRFMCKMSVIQLINFIYLLKVNRC